MLAGQSDPLFLPKSMLMKSPTPSTDDPPQEATYKVNIGVEIRIESMKKDNSHSWVRISHGLNKLVTELSNKKDDDNEQEISEMQFEDFALKTNVLAFANRTKSKAKPRRRTPACSSTKTVPIGKRIWTKIEPQDCSPSDYPMSKQLSAVLRHGIYFEDDGAIEFSRRQDCLWHEFENPQHWSDEMWKSTMAKDFNIVLVHQDKKFFFSELFKGIQDAISSILHDRTIY